MILTFFTFKTERNRKPLIYIGFTPCHVTGDHIIVRINDASLHMNFPHKDELEALMKKISHTLGISILTLCLGLYSFAYANEKVDGLLAQATPPEGVVFEIASGDINTLKLAIPAIQRHSDALRKKFPDLSIAVVSHGREQFSLTRNNDKKYAQVHQGVQSLVKNSHISVYVCETYAGRKGLDAADFPDYIDVAAAGPAQINDYVSLGYVLIRIRGDE